MLNLKNGMEYQKTIGELRAKIRDMEQKASNTVRAVARGVSGNGAKQAINLRFKKKR